MAAVTGKEPADEAFDEYVRAFTPEVVIALLALLKAFATNQAEVTIAIPNKNTYIH